jgi:hypothetical protein
LEHLAAPRLVSPLFPLLLIHSYIDAHSPRWLRRESSHGHASSDEQQSYCQPKGFAHQNPVHHSSHDTHPPQGVICWDPASVLPRIPLPRTPVNRSTEKGQSSDSRRPFSLQGALLTTSTLGIAPACSVPPEEGTMVARRPPLHHGSTGAPRVSFAHLIVRQTGGAPTYWRSPCLSYIVLHLASGMP